MTGARAGRFTPERRTSADQLKAVLREHPADTGFADDLLAAHADIRSSFSEEVHARLAVEAMSNGKPRSAYDGAVTT